jgi:hypothetical protein
MTTTQMAGTPQQITTARQIIAEVTEALTGYLDADRESRTTHPGFRLVRTWQLTRADVPEFLEFLAAQTNASEVITLFGRNRQFSTVRVVMAFRRFRAA